MTDHAREAADKPRPLYDYTPYGTQKVVLHHGHNIAAIQSAIDAATADLRAERLLLAKLAADEPQFYNPMEAMAAKALRDRVLQEAADQLKQRGGESDAT